METQTGIITRAEKQDDGKWSLTWDGWGLVAECWLDGFEIKEGDEIEVSAPLGFQPRRVAINGTVIYEKDQEYMDDQHAVYLAESRMAKRRDLFRNREAYRARVEALPAPFKTRIQWFIDEKGFDDFFLDVGTYELFILEQAAEIYNAVDDPAVIRRIRDYSHEEAVKALPFLDSGHSGMTWAAAFGLAAFAREGQEI